MCAKPSIVWFGICDLRVPVMQSSLMTYSSSILAVLKSLLECLVQTGSGFQRVRANYYGALLNLLRVVQRPAEVERRSGSALERVIQDPSSDTERLRQSHAETLFSYSDQLMEVICRDVCGSHEVTQMLSLATLDAVVSLDVHQHWLSYLSRKGYLRHLVSSLSSADDDIRVLLVKGPKAGASLRSLYVLESKTALFTRLATSPTGAQALLENGLVSKLAECQAIDLHPDVSGSLPEFVPTSQWPCLPMVECYRQFFIPVVQLLLAITASLGVNHREAGLQIQQFLVAHGEVCSSILQPRNLRGSTAVLEEVSLVSALVSQIADDSEGIRLEQQGRLRLLRHQMLSLLPWLAFKSPGTGSPERILRLRICCSMLRFCCNVCVLAGPKDRSSCRALFAPTVCTDATSFDQLSCSEVSSMASPAPGLGFLVQMLLSYSAEAQRAAAAYDGLIRKRDALGDLGTAELAELLPGDAAQTASLAPSKLRSAVRKRVESEATLTRKELSLLTLAIERALFLLWRHLEYFLVQCVPHGEIKRGLIQSTVPEPSLTGLKIMPATSHGVVTVEEVEALKADAKATLNDAFFRRVQVRESYLRGSSPSDPKFFEALVRRLKRLAMLQTK